MAPDLKQKISEWRSAYGAIFKVTIKGREFVYRPLTIEEFSSIDETTEDEEVVLIALLHPIDLAFDELPAGIVTTLAERIMQASMGSPDNLNEELSLAREKLKPIHQQLKVVVLAAFPTTLEETIDAWTLPQLIYKAALSEEVLYVRQLKERVVLEFSEEVPDEPPAAQMPFNPVEEQMRSHLAEGFAAPEKKAPVVREGRAKPNDPIAAKLRRAMIHGE